MTYAEFGERLAASGALPEGFPSRDAEWLARAALHGGLFLRSQYEAGVGASRKAAQRVVERLVAAGVGVEVDGGAGFGHYFHVTARSVYRAVGMGDSRLRRTAARGATLQRLLALDCVIAHPDLPWIPGRETVIAMLGRRGVPEEDLPQRSYTGADGAPARVVYLPARWPVALGDDAVWAFPDSGQSGNPRLDLRTWGSQHAAAWRALRRGGCEPRALFVTRSERRAEQARAEFRSWAEKGLACPGVPDEEVEKAAAEVERIKSGLQAHDRAVIEEYGGLNPVLRRLNELDRTVAEGGGGRFRMERSSAWISERLQLRSALVGGPEPEISFEVRRL